MLDLLHIENIAVIEEADIPFRGGFNALTGETGAGKSIVIDALGAVLGGRTSRDLIRTGSAKAFVSAAFSGVPADLPVWAESGVHPDEDGAILIERELSADGKNLCRINGRPATVARLRLIGREMVNIHGQHDGQQLLDEDRHGAYLDRFGKTEAALFAYRREYDAMTAIRDEMKSLRMDAAERARRVDSLRFQIDELERAELVPGEEEELIRRRNLLRSADKYLSALSSADFYLNGDDESAGAVGQIQEAQDAVERIQDLSGDLAAIWQRLDAARREVYDLAETIRDRRAEFDLTRWRAEAIFCTVWKRSTAPRWKR